MTPRPRTLVALPSQSLHALEALFDESPVTISLDGAAIKTIAQRLAAEIAPATTASCAPPMSGFRSKEDGSMWVHDPHESGEFSTVDGELATGSGQLANVVRFERRRKSA